MADTLDYDIDESSKIVKAKIDALKASMTEHLEESGQYNSGEAMVTISLEVARLEGQVYLLDLFDKVLEESKFGSIRQSMQENLDRVSEELENGGNTPFELSNAQGQREVHEAVTVWLEKFSQITVA